MEEVSGFKKPIILAVILILLLAFAYLDLSVSAVDMSFSQIVDGILCRGDPLYSKLIWTYTMPRVAMAFFIGAGLAVTGAVMQAIFRNPLASPYVLGLSSGASVGAAIAMMFTIPFLPTMLAAPVLAFVFCLATMFLVYNVSRIGGRVSTETLILTGMAISSMFSAVVSLLTYLAGEKMANIVFWTMGSLSQYGWDNAMIIIPLIIFGIILLLSRSRDLNAIMLSDAHAQDLGINVGRVRLELLVASALVTAACVAFTGVIGFVGLVIPHVIRILIGPDNRMLIPFSMLAGAMFLLACDYLCRVVLSGDVLPIGVVTALIGAPYFIYLIRRRKTEVGWS